MGHKLEQVVADNYPRIATELLTPILDLLRLSRKHCGGDVDKFLVILVVAIRTAKHRDFAARSPQELSSGELPIFPGFGATIRSIAESLEIPNETVRRKVRELVEAGWLARVNSKLYVTADSYQQLAPVREQLQRLAVVHHQAVATLGS